MRDVMRAVSVLVAGGLAGLLVWISTQVDASTRGGYWAAEGILAGAGLVLALPQVRPSMRTGRPRLSAPILLVGFLLALVAVAWVAVSAEPHPASLQRHVVSWSDDVGIRAVIDDLLAQVSVLAFGLGLLLGIAGGSAWPRREPAGPPAPAEAEPEPAALSPGRERARGGMVFLP